MPHEPPPQHPPVSHEGAEAYEGEENDDIETCVADINRLCSFELQVGQTTSSTTSLTLWYTSYCELQDLH
jgi:hypothetical protein